MRRSTLRAGSMVAVLYLALVWAAPASVVLVVEVPGAIWLAGKMGVLFAVVMFLRGYSPVVVEWIAAQLAAIVEDE